MSRANTEELGCWVVYISHASTRIHLWARREGVPTAEVGEWRANQEGWLRIRVYKLPRRTQGLLREYARPNCPCLSAAQLTTCRGFCSNVGKLRNDKVTASFPQQWPSAWNP
jgi:hypothetical protein